MVQTKEVSRGMRVQTHLFEREFWEKVVMRRSRKEVRRLAFLAVYVMLAQDARNAKPDFTR